MRALYILPVLIMLLVGTLSPAFATVDFTGYIPIDGQPITPNFKFTRVVNISYPNGGKLKDALDGQNQTISFTLDNSNPSVQKLMQDMQSAMTATGSTAKITGLKLNYVAQINGHSTEASITYLIQIIPTIENYVIYKGTVTTVSGVMGGGTPYIMDAAWAGFNLNQAETISTPQNGNLEINFPINLIQKDLPNVYSMIKGTPAEKALQAPLMDASVLYTQQALANWDHLFDPSYVVSDSDVLHYKGAKVAVTTFSTGVSNLQSGTMAGSTQNIDFTADQPYKMTVIDQAASGTYNVEGTAQAYNVKGAPAFTTTLVVSGTVSTTTAGGISNMTLYGMAGGAAVIAVIVFMWSNKKMKQVVTNIDTGPVVYETRQHWADKIDSTTPASAPPKQEEEPQKDWLCFKCGYYTLNSQNTCSHCGAPRPT